MNINNIKQIKYTLNNNNRINKSKKSRALINYSQINLFLKNNSKTQIKDIAFVDRNSNLDKA